MVVSAPWSDSARALKKALVTSVAGRRGFKRHLCGQRLRLAYEARKHSTDRDYLLLQQFARDRSCVFDVGLNVGLTSLLMHSKMAPAGRIYGFEASEEACRIAQRNFELNGLSDRIRVINTLVGERSGDSIDFYWARDSGGASIFKGRLGHSYAIRKSTLALDDFCERTAVKPEFVKIDVEGAEVAALRGSSRMLTTCRPVIIVEVHGWQEMSVADNAKAILEHISKADYAMIYLRTQQRILDVSVLADRGRCHLLLLPAEHAPPDWLVTFDTSGL